MRRATVCLLVSCGAALVRPLTHSLDDVADHATSLLEPESIVRIRRRTQLAHKGGHHGHQCGGHHGGGHHGGSHQAFGLPVINVGMPKSGSNSLFDFFCCGGFKSSHFHCKQEELHSPKHLCGACIQDNVKHGRPPFAGCGGYDVWAQTNIFPAESKTACFFPQIMALDAIHKHYPNATFILPTRPPDHWVASVDSWDRGSIFSTRDGFVACDLPNLPAGVPKAGSDAELKSFYKDFSGKMRKWVAAHPSHRLVEFDIEQPSAARTLSRAFGIKEQCWGQANCHSSCDEWAEIAA